MNNHDLTLVQCIRKLFDSLLLLLVGSLFLLLLLNSVLAGENFPRKNESTRMMHVFRFLAVLVGRVESEVGLSCRVDKVPPKITLNA